MEFDKKHNIELNNKYIDYINHAMRNDLYNHYPYIHAAASYQNPAITDIDEVALTTGSKILINPQLAEDEYNKLDLYNSNISRQTFIKYIIIHEVLHCLYRHFSRCGARHKGLWNIACDIRIADDMKHFDNYYYHRCGFKTISEQVLKQNLMIDKLSFRDKIPLMTTEIIYDKLLCEENLYDKMNCMSPMFANGRTEQCEDGDNDKQAINGELQTGKQAKRRIEDRQEQEDKEKQEAKANRHYKEEDKSETIGEDSEIQTSAIGNIPGDTIRKILNASNRSLGWKQILERLFTEPLNDNGWITRDRRFSNIFIPEPYLEPMPSKLVIAVDTSGSIDEKMLAIFMHNVKYINDVTNQYDAEVIVCDTMIHTVKKLNNLDIDKDIKGGGGTSFIPVFDYVRKNIPETECLIYFTDTYGDFPMKQPNYLTIWAIPLIYWNNSPTPWGKRMPLI